MSIKRKSSAAAPKKGAARKSAPKKAATKKATAKRGVKVTRTKKETVSPIEDITSSFTTTISIKKFDWSKVPTGTTFEAKIRGKKCKGQIFNDKGGRYVYFCQNGIQGSKGPHNLGYSYTWSNSYNHDTEELIDEYNDITHLVLGPIPEGFVEPVILPEMGGYKPVVRKGKVEFGCKTVSNEHIRLLVSQLVD